MHSGGYRVNGGIGFAIDEPKAVLNFEVAEKFEIEDRRLHGFSQSELIQLGAVVSEAKTELNLIQDIKVHLEGGMRTHYGMGSATAIRLAVLEGLLLINKRKINRAELVSLSKRGGTSGIGVNVYFDGGFVFDLGVKSPTTGFRPSSKVQNPKTPLLLSQFEMPNWKVGLCVPKNAKPKTQEEEAEFFENTCPIVSTESYRVLYHCLFGAYAAVRELDIDAFAESINAIQTCEWKMKERHQYRATLLQVEKRLYESGVLAVGMSSLGPLLFFLTHDGEYDRIVAEMQGEDCEIFVSSCSNSGRTIIM
jgi:beta-ribofuranosylaminobenzene 5'-phosphate synthase